MQEYLVYKLQSPSGRCYIGYTSQPLAERFRQHVNKAGKGYIHPLASAIRKYGAENFEVSVVATHSSRVAALADEVVHIAQHPGGYNLSPGGNDGEFGRAQFARLLEDPEYRAAYSKKLSAGIKNSAAHRAAWEQLAAILQTWRKENPKEANKIQRRATRAARRATLGKPSYNSGGKHTEETRLKISMALLASWAKTPPSVKKRKSITTRKTVTQVWAQRTEDEVKALAVKISDTLKKHNANLTTEELAERDERLKITRSKIDHTVRKANQKKALKEYWTPERRAQRGAQFKAMWAEKQKERA